MVTILLTFFCELTRKIFDSSCFKGESNEKK